MRRPADLTGRRNGMLVVQRRASEWRTYGGTMWECLCDCGRTTTAPSSALRPHRKESCGCWQRANILRLTVAESAEWRALLDTLCEAVTRYPQRPIEIRRTFEDTWGSCDARRFWRALRTLVATGRIVHTGRRQTEESMYALPQQRRMAA